MAFDGALGPAVAGIDTTDEDEAQRQVAEALTEAHAAGQRALVNAALVEAKARARETEREQRAVERAAAERKRIEKDGRKALTKVFGAGLANRVDLFTEYTLVHIHEELTLACPRGAVLDELRSKLRSELHIGVVEGKSAHGYQLARITDADELDHVVTSVDDALDHVVTSVDDALEPVRQLEAAKQAASNADRARRAEEAQALREQAAQRREFGTVL
jgi:hypothetical protein